MRRNSTTLTLVGVTSLDARVLDAFDLDACGKVLSSTHQSNTQVPLLNVLEKPTCALQEIEGIRSVVLVC